MCSRWVYKAMVLFPLIAQKNKNKTNKNTADKRQQKKWAELYLLMAWHASQEEDNNCPSQPAQKYRDKHKHGHSKMERRREQAYLGGQGGGAGLNFTGFADSRKGGGNAMG